MSSTPMLRLLLAFVALLFLTGKAAACSCFGARQLDGFHPCLAYASADAVFTGLAEEVTTGARGPFAPRVFRFTVDEAFVGVDGPTVEVETAATEAACGYSFQHGKRYFVYAHRNSDGKLTEFLCGSTVPLESATRDLAYAREIARGEKGVRIAGAVVTYQRPGLLLERNRIPVAGVDVWLEQGDRMVSKTVTNGDGQYEFRGIDVGTYRVRLGLPIGPRELLPPDKTQKDHSVYLRQGMRCELESFTLTTSSSVVGRLVTPDNSPLPRHYLVLLPVDQDGKEMISSSGWPIGLSSPQIPSVSSLPESGNYYFNDVPPGRYLLAVNPLNKPAKSDPAYPLMYYPGVMTRDQATVIVVSGTREISLENFRLTPPLSERWFSGMVLMADRSPAVGARVILIDPNDRMMGTNVIEVTTDELGRFRVKGYETFPYWIDAYISRGSEQWAPPVKLPASGGLDGIELVISSNSRSQPYHKN